MARDELARAKAAVLKIVRDVSAKGDDAAAGVDLGPLAAFAAPLIEVLATVAWTSRSRVFLRVDAKPDGPVSMTLGIPDGEKGVARGSYTLQKDETGEWRVP